MTGASHNIYILGKGRRSTKRPGGVVGNGEGMYSIGLWLAVYLGLSVCLPCYLFCGGGRQHNKYFNEEVFNRIDKLAINIRPRVVVACLAGWAAWVDWYPYNNNSWYELYYERNWNCHCAYEGVHRKAKDLD